MKSFITLIESVLTEEKKSVKDSIIEFFQKNPDPKDMDVHALADELGLEHSDLESQIYQILADFFSQGDWEGKGEPEVDADQLELGTKIEREHTTNKAIAERIAKDHLSELKDYYTRLKNMEGDAEKEATEITESLGLSSILSEAEVDVEKETTVNSEGDVQEDSEVDDEKDEKDTNVKKGIEDKYIWNIECYDISGIRQLYIYASESRISYDSYKADPYNMLLYVDKNYGQRKFGDLLSHRNRQDQVQSREFILDNDGLSKEVVDYLVDMIKSGDFNWKVSVI